MYTIFSVTLGWLGPPSKSNSITSSTDLHISSQSFRLIDIALVLRR